eukprot:10959277-Heterocapsa_arctica.AAC.1
MHSFDTPQIQNIRNDQSNHADKCLNFLTDAQTKHSFFNGPQNRQTAMNKAKQIQAAKTTQHTTNKAIVQEAVVDTLVETYTMVEGRRKQF